MKRGFVTIATGNIQYFKIAANLLASYRYQADEKMPFAIICDRENQYTDLFDDVVILDKVYHSYLDKLCLTEYAPYDETIFIDADSLAYKDLNDFWNFFPEKEDFSAFGKDYPLDYPYAWFKAEDTGEFREKITFLPEFIGGVYFIRRTEKLKNFTATVQYILKNYYRYKFIRFNDPADETIFALAMAVHGMHTVDRTLAPICFFLLISDFYFNITQNKVRYLNRYELDHGPYDEAYLVHWGSSNTKSNPYLREVLRLNRLVKGRDDVRMQSVPDILAKYLRYYPRALILSARRGTFVRDMLRSLRGGK